MILLQVVNAFLSDLSKVKQIQIQVYHHAHVFEFQNHIFQAILFFMHFIDLDKNLIHHMLHGIFQIGILFIRNHRDPLHCLGYFLFSQQHDPCHIP